MMTCLCHMPCKEMSSSKSLNPHSHHLKLGPSGLVDGLCNRTWSRVDYGPTKHSVSAFSLFEGHILDTDDIHTHIMRLRAWQWQHPLDQPTTVFLAENTAWVHSRQGGHKRWYPFDGWLTFEFHRCVLWIYQSRVSLIPAAISQPRESPCQIMWLWKSTTRAA
jgi:hypothetical protein